MARDSSRSKLPLKIPARVRIKARVFYSIVWQETIEGKPDCLGLCDPQARTITIKLGQSDTETIKTFIHELIHAIECEWDQPIPHKITYTLEEGIFGVLKLNGWI